MSIPWFYEPLEGIEQEMVEGNMIDNKRLKSCLSLVSVDLDKGMEQEMVEGNMIENRRLKMSFPSVAAP